MHKSDFPVTPTNRQKLAVINYMIPHHMQYCPEDVSRNIFGHSIRLNWCKICHEETGWIHSRYRRDVLCRCPCHRVSCQEEIALRIYELQQELETSLYGKTTLIRLKAKIQAFLKSLIFSKEIL